MKFILIWLPVAMTGIAPIFMYACCPLEIQPGFESIEATARVKQFVIGNVSFVDEADLLNSDPYWRERAYDKID